jgi:hypothetical protein
MTLTMDWNADRTAVVLSLGFELDPVKVITKEGKLPATDNFGVFNLAKDQCLSVAIPALALSASDNTVVLASSNFVMKTGGDKTEHGHPASTSEKVKTEHGHAAIAPKTEHIAHAIPAGGNGGIKTEHGARGPMIIGEEGIGFKPPQD